jgi:hypothetical protein
MIGLDTGQLVLRDRSNGSETVIATHGIPIGGAGSIWPQVSPDGTRVIYRAIADPPGHYLGELVGGSLTL